VCIGTVYVRPLSLATSDKAGLVSVNGGIEVVPVALETKRSLLHLRQRK
jgi:hypothetical protein